MSPTNHVSQRSHRSGFRVKDGGSSERMRLSTRMKSKHESTDEVIHPRTNRGEGANSDDRVVTRSRSSKRSKTHKSDGSPAARHAKIPALFDESVQDLCGAFMAPPNVASYLAQTHIGGAEDDRPLRGHSVNPIENLFRPDTTDDDPSKSTPEKTVPIFSSLREENQYKKGLKAGMGDREARAAAKAHLQASEAAKARLEAGKANLAKFNASVNQKLPTLEANAATLKQQSAAQSNQQSQSSTTGGAGGAGPQRPPGQPGPPGPSGSTVRTCGHCRDTAPNIHISYCFKCGSSLPRLPTPRSGATGVARVDVTPDTLLPDPILGGTYIVTFSNQDPPENGINDPYMMTGGAGPAGTFDDDGNLVPLSPSMTPRVTSQNDERTIAQSLASSRKQEAMYRAVSGGLPVPVPQPYFNELSDATLQQLRDGINKRHRERESPMAKAARKARQAARKRENEAAAIAQGSEDEEQKKNQAAEAAKKKAEKEREAAEEEAAKKAAQAQAGTTGQEDAAKKKRAEALSKAMREQQAARAQARTTGQEEAPGTKEEESLKQKRAALARSVSTDRSPATKKVWLAKLLDVAQNSRRQGVVMSHTDFPGHDLLSEAEQAILHQDCDLIEQRIHASGSNPPIEGAGKPMSTPGQAGAGDAGAGAPGGNPDDDDDGSDKEGGDNNKGQGGPGKKGAKKKDEENANEPPSLLVVAAHRMHFMALQVPPQNFPTDMTEWNQLNDAVKQQLYAAGIEVTRQWDKARAERRRNRMY